MKNCIKCGGEIITAYGYRVCKECGDVKERRK